MSTVSSRRRAPASPRKGFRRAPGSRRPQPRRPGWGRGTDPGKPLAVAAGLATLEQLDPQAYDRLLAVTETLAAGLRDAAHSAGRAVEVQDVPGLLTVFFTSAGPVRDYAGAAACDTETY